jgi:hypothetical protein
MTQMMPPSALELARIKMDALEAAMEGYARFHLPQRLSRAFAGKDGRHVFTFSVVFGNGIWPEQHEKKYGDMVRRAQRFLSTKIQFRKLYEAHFDAFEDWSVKQWEWDEKERLESLNEEDPNAEAEREFWQDQREACHDDGLV